MVRRIVLPFLGALVVLTLLMAWRTTRITSTLLETEYWDQMDRIASLLVQYPYLLNPTIHFQLEELVGARIGYYDLKGRPQGETVAGREGKRTAVPWPVLPPDVLKALARDRGSFLFTPQGTPRETMILLSRIDSPSQNGLILGLMVPAGPRRELRQSFFYALAVNAGISLLLLLLLVYSFSRLFSRRLGQLLATMEEVAEGRLQQQVPETGSPEWRRLAVAFNRMVIRLEQYQQRLRASERLAAVGELSAVLAHEVRNPLTSLKMMAQVLRRRHDDEEETVQLIDPMLSEVDRIEQLVKSILDWSRPPSLHPVTTDINDLVSEVLHLARPLFSKSGIEIRWKPGVVQTVSADRSGLKQVLWNLLKNAQHASSPADTVEIVTRMSDENGVQVIIRDQGTGIEAKDREKIFEPFYTTRKQGLGLGLTICRRIIEQHGGSLTLENPDQGGVQATVTLPVYRVAFSGTAAKSLVDTQEEEPHG